MMSQQYDTLERLFRAYIESAEDTDSSRLYRSLYNVSETQWLDILSNLGGGEVIQCAAENGHIDLISRIVANIPSETKRFKLLISKERSGFTAVHYAAIRGNLVMMKYLINSVLPMHGLALLEERTYDNETVIHLAAANGHENIIQYVLKQIPAGKAFDMLKQVTCYGETVLHCASTNGIFDYILKNIPEKERRDMLRRTTEAVTTKPIQASTTVEELSSNAKPANYKVVRGEDEKIEQPVSLLMKELKQKISKLSVPTEPYNDEPYRKDDGFPPNYIEKVEESEISLTKECNQRITKPSTLPKPTRRKVKKSGDVSPSYTEKSKVSGSFLTKGFKKPPIPPKPISLAAKERSDDVSPSYTEKSKVSGSFLTKGFKKPPISPKPKWLTVKEPDALPPNYINKVKQLESFRENLSDKKVEFKEKEALVTERITELQREVKEKEVVTEERNELKYKCNRLENDLYDYKQQLKWKDEVIYKLSSAQADLASTTKVLTDTNLCQELLIEKRKIEDDREKTRAELEAGRVKLQKCEEKLQEQQSKEQGTIQEQEILDKKRETYKLVVDKLEKKETELEEQFQRYQMEKEKLPKRRTVGRLLTDTLPPVTTVAQQNEACGEQEVGSFSDDDEMEGDYIMSVYGERLESNVADVGTETVDDKKEIQAEPADNVYIQEKENDGEINTRYYRGIDAASDDVISDEADMLRADEEILSQEIEKILAEAENEIEDMKEIKEGPINYVCTQVQAREIEINTRYDEDIYVEALKQVWRCRKCGSLETEKVIRRKTEDDSWFC